MHVFNPPLRMVIVGAVHIAQPLARMAVEASYEVTVVDPRRAFATHYVGEETWLYRCDVQETEPVH